MKYLFDSNAWIAFLKRSSPQLQQRMAATDEHDIVLCSIVLSELIYGAHRSTRPDSNLQAVSEIRERFVSYPFDDDCADACGRVRADLSTTGTPIGPNDFMIAAVALANDLTVVTRNVREFNRVPGLRVENWESP